MGNRFRGDGQPPPAPTDVDAWRRTPSNYGPSKENDAKPSTTVQVFPPWLYEIPSAQDFFKQAGRPPLALPGVAGTTLEPASLQYTVPAGYQAIVRFITIFVDSPTTNLDVIWTALINGAPVAGYENLASFPRVASNLSIDFDTMIRVPQNALFSIRITNNNANAWNIGASYGGWSWPTQDADRLTGGMYGTQG